MNEALEPVSGRQLDALLSAVRRAHGTAGALLSGLMEADGPKGRRKIGENTHEMWTTDKRKITIAVLTDGGLCVSCSKTADPDYPA